VSAPTEDGLRCAEHDQLVDVLLQQARDGDAAVAELAALRAQLARDEARRATERAAEDRARNERQRLSLDTTLNGLIDAELDAGNDERAAALRCLRAWNRGAGYVIQRRIS
jgi:hypothetical protein